MYTVETVKQPMGLYGSFGKFLEEDAFEKFGDGAKVVKVGYSDYGGTFFDRVLIEWYKENEPDKIVWFETSYRGQIAYIRVSDDEIEGSVYDFNIWNYDDFYYELEYEAFESAAKDYCERNGCMHLYEDVLQWIEGHSRMEPNTADYFEGDLDDFIFPRIAEKLDDKVKDMIVVEALTKKVSELERAHWSYSGQKFDDAKIVIDALYSIIDEF